MRDWRQIWNGNAFTGKTGAWLAGILTGLCAVIGLAAAIRALIRFQLYDGFLVIAGVFALILIQVLLLRKFIRD